MSAITIHVDGACTLMRRHEDGRHTGPGGWAWVRLDDHNRVLSYASGAELHTTNQRMELTAAIEALRAHAAADVEIVSDSAYVVMCFQQVWHKGWLKRGWRNANGRPVANKDLWQELLAEALERPRTVTWTHVRGHADDPGNIEADRLAVLAKKTVMI